MFDVSLHTNIHTYIHKYSDFLVVLISVGLAQARPNNSYLPVIGVHEMHGRMHPNYWMHLMHPNYWQITMILLVVDLCSSLGYFIMIQPLPIAGKLPIKTSVARQLPTNIYIYRLYVTG